MLHGQQMSDGNIVAFRRPMASIRSASPPPEAERGTVLVFTGIRYERPIETTVPPSPAAGPGGEACQIGREGH